MIAWIDAQVGLAGDMLLGALIDAGAPVEGVRSGLAALAIPGWELEISEVRRGSFRAVRAAVAVGGVPADTRFTRPRDHVHRPWREIRALLAAAPLPPRVVERALAAYGRLARAEAALHGAAVDDVELHEVGSTDAIVDIVGCCLALELLGVDRLVASPLPLGTGSVQGAHGRIPLPAPATLAVLEGWPVVPSVLPGEWVTPTGAALVAALAVPGPPPPMVLAKIGHGAGQRDPKGVANLVRVVLGRPTEAVLTDVVAELACNLDDFPGQAVPPAIDALLAAGALDAWTEPVAMKKGRPGLVLHALVRPADVDRLSDVALRHTSTLGVRTSLWTRRLLDRRVETAETPWGPVRVKIAERAGVRWHAWPEFEDCLAIALAHDLPVHEVQQAALSAWNQASSSSASSSSDSSSV